MDWRTAVILSILGILLLCAIVRRWRLHARPSFERCFPQGQGARMVYFMHADQEGASIFFGDLRTFQVSDRVQDLIKVLRGDFVQLGRYYINRSRLDAIRDRGPGIARIYFKGSVIPLEIRGYEDAEAVKREFSF